MKIKVIKRAEKDGRITGVFDYGTLGGISELTIDIDTIKTADNISDFSQRIEECLLKSAPAIAQNIEDSKIPPFEKKVKIFGEQIIEQTAIEQIKNCIVHPDDIAVLTADAHFGYGHPIGGAIAYKNKVSLSGVGFDIGCGNKAVMTNIKSSDIDNIKKIMKEISKQIGFGVGRPNPKPIDHPVINDIANAEFEPQRNMISMAIEQLGTVGSGNHFINLFTDENDVVWIGVHFGSRGFGHKTTTGFLSMHQGKSFTDHASEGKKDERPVLFDMSTEVGQDYYNAVMLAGEYAHAGRDIVVNKVLEIIGAKSTYEVHNHHNFVWKEQHFGQDYYVVRKGCTPAFPGQQGFIGANMMDDSVIVEGIDSPESREGLFSTVHGAGRILSRTKAAGKGKWQKMGKGKRMKVITTPGIVDFDKVKTSMSSANITLIGAGADEAPECYKNLEEVLKYQGNTIKVLHKLRPIGVIMAGNDTYDPYAD